MKKYNIYLLAGLIALGACTEKKGWNITLKGKIKFPDSSRVVYLQRVNVHHKVQGANQEIAVSQDGTFETTINMEEPGYYRINFYDLQQVDFVANRSDLEINADGDMPSGIFEIKGSPDDDLLERVYDIMRETRKLPRAVELEEAFGEAQAAGDMEKIMEIQESYMDIVYEGQDKIAVLLKEQGPSLAVIRILTQGGMFSYDRYADLYNHVAEELKKEWPTYTSSKEFIALVERSRKIAVGQPALEISLPDTEGQVVKLSSFRGKYVLVDFWAKWCAPCRQENPNVVRAYNQYHDKGFEVLSVSLDDKRADWLKAIEEDGLVWTNVSDLKAFDSQVVQDYQINAIPMSFLVDPKGVIIAKDLRGNGLSDQLEAIFGSPS